MSWTIVRFHIYSEGLADQNGETLGKWEVYLDYLAQAIVHVFVSTRFTLVGNSTVHHPVWLLVGALNTLYDPFSDLPLQASRPIFERWFMDVVWRVFAVSAFVLLAFEQRNGVGAHLAEVEQQCEQYTKRRVNEKSASHVRC